MKEPVSELPWKIKEYQLESYDVTDAIGEDVFNSSPYNDYAPLKEDRDYIVEACNNYPEAVSLLKEYMKEPDAGNHDLNPKIEEFLRKIEGKE